jgi:hypothetical protein
MDDHGRTSPPHVVRHTLAEERADDQLWIEGVDGEADRAVVHRLLPRDVMPCPTELYPHPLGQSVER